MSTVHRDPVMFREALRCTCQCCGFPERMLEKDYFTSVLLEYLADTCPQLVFKGGTCLAKVHADFYRLSEDLDFVIPMATQATRAQRSKAATGVKRAIAALPGRLPVFRVPCSLKGANSSTQYTAVIGYSSLVAETEETIKIDIGLREPLLLPVCSMQAKTLLLDPVSRRPLLAPVKVRCISKLEAFAEKSRAALSRREVAARDFFDLDYAVRHMELQPDDPEFTRMVRQKLAVPGNDPVDVSPGRLATLRCQVDPQLRSVLRARDYAEFDLDRAFKLVVDLAARVA